MSVPEPLVFEQRPPAPKRKPRRRRFLRLKSTFASAVAWFFGCAAIGILTLIAGVFILAGVGWGIIAIGLAFLLAALGLQIGIARG